MKIFLIKVLRKKSVQILLIIAFTVLVRKAYIKINNMILTPAGAEVSLEELSEDVRKIAYNEKIKGRSSIIDLDASVANEFRGKLEKINEYDRILEIGITRFSWLLFSIPIDNERKGEIKTLVKTFFYINTHELPVNIIGIKLYYSIFMSGKVNLYITIEEFEELYREVYVEGLPIEEQVDLLVNIIIEKSGYIWNGDEYWINNP